MRNEASGMYIKGCMVQSANEDLVSRTLKIKIILGHNGLRMVNEFKSLEKLFEPGSNI